MRKLGSFLMALALVGSALVFAAGASAQSTVPQNRARPHKYERRGSGIKRSYKRAGKSAARGGKRFGRNMYRGKPIVASKQLGKGVGGFGKNTGVGTARVGKKVGKTIKHAVTP
jgi:hypothetical protein